MSLLVIFISIVACRPQDDSTAAQLTGGDTEQGKLAISRYGCGGCHTIPGVENAGGRVGPSLEGIASRSYLAGQAPNQPENMITWIREPQRMSPGSAMPNMNVTEQDARDIAAYLYTLR